MNYFTLLFGLTLALGAGGCSSPSSPSVNAEGLSVDSVNVRPHSSEHGAHHSEGGANEFMHKAPFDTLVKRFESPQRLEWQKPDKVIQMLQPLSGKTVADIGAGTGYFSFRLASRASKVIAIDVDPKFIEYLNKEVKKNNYKNIEVRQTSTQTPGLKEQEADKVLIVNTYHHIDKREDWLKSLKKGMKKEGALYIVDFKKGKLPEGPPDEYKLSSAQAVQELEKAGFYPTQIDTQTLAYQYIIIALPR
jgi:ubiquinone/menaquinone biosynthesis C-methylase UbiE